MCRCGITIWLLGVMLAWVTSGCQIGGQRSFSNANDRLREENLQLNKQVKQLEEDLTLRRAEVDTLKQHLSAAGTVGGPPKNLENEPGYPGVDAPRVTRVEFSGYSGAVDTDADGVDDLVRVYVRTLDQKGRMIPVLGHAVIQVVAIEPGQPPTEFANRAYTSKDLDQAYRRGLTGTHYTLETALPTPLPRPVDEATVKLTFTETSTGVVLTHQQGISLRARLR